MQHHWSVHQSIKYSTNERTIYFFYRVDDGNTGVGLKHEKCIFIGGYTHFSLGIPILTYSDDLEIDFP